MFGASEIETSGPSVTPAAVASSAAWARALAIASGSAFALAAATALRIDASLRRFSGSGLASPIPFAVSVVAGCCACAGAAASADSGEQRYRQGGGDAGHGSPPIRNRLGTLVFRRTVSFVTVDLSAHRPVIPPDDLREVLHAIYRSTAKVNTKPRPAGFSKLRSLESFLQAWSGQGDLIFLNDGPVASGQLVLMEAAGTVIVRPASDAMGAYWTALELALEQPWADDDLVYFGEDDYLYRPDAFRALAAAAQQLPHADHFAPYATIGHTMPNGEPLHAGLKRPRGAAGEALGEVDDVMWHRATSHTVSFAIRVRALREDRTIHHLALEGQRRVGPHDVPGLPGHRPLHGARAGRAAARRHGRAGEPAGQDRALARWR